MNRDPFQYKYFQMNFHVRKAIGVSPCVANCGLLFVSCVIASLKTSDKVTNVRHICWMECVHINLDLTREFWQIEISKREPDGNSGIKSMATFQSPSNWNFSVQQKPSNV